MDFISLANAAHETSRHVFRLLIEDTTSTPNIEDDDFIGYEYTSSGAANTAAQQQYTTGTTSMPQLENRPLLSPSAESALLELSTNFLLYVAMVMITTMVAKIYFPSWLEPREEPQTRISNHAYMNVMQDAYNDDLSDEEEDEDEDEDFEGGRYRDSNGGESNKSSSNGEEEGGSIFLDAGNADDTDDLTPNNGGGRMSRTASSSFLFDYDQETQSKNSVYRNLALCAIMLNVTFVSWGLLQVSLFCVCMCVYSEWHLFVHILCLLFPYPSFTSRNVCSHVVILVSLENTSHTHMHWYLLIVSGHSSCRVCYCYTSSRELLVVQLFMNIPSHQYQTC